MLPMTRIPPHKYHFSSPKENANLKKAWLKLNRYQKEIDWQQVQIHQINYKSWRMISLFIKSSKSTSNVILPATKLPKLVMQFSKVRQLEFAAAPELTEEQLYTFANQFKHFKQVVGLKLDFYNQRALSHYSLTAILSQLKTLPHLKHLHLDFRECQQLINSDSLWYLAYIFSRIKKLTSLCLYCDQVDVMSPQVMQCLARQISGMGQLNQLKLILKLFLASDWNNEPLAYQFGFTPAIKNLTKLQDLKLEVYGRYPIEHWDIYDRLAFDLEQLALAINNYPQLANLYLKFASLDFKVEEWNNLFAAIIARPQLINLHLALDLSFLTTANSIRQLVNKLVEVTQHVSSTVLELCWIRRLLEAEVIGSIIDYLPPLFAGHSTKILWCASKINSTCIQQLFKLLPQLLPLSTLGASFEQNNCSEDSTIILHKDASCLRLELNSITADQIAAIIAGLGQLLNCQAERLESLSLNFDSWRGLNDDMCQQLWQALAQLKQLSQLELDFNFCAKITGLTLDNLRLAIGELSNLQSVSMCFYGCKHIKTGDAIQLKQQLGQKLTNLKNLEINV